MVGREMDPPGDWGNVVYLWELPVHEGSVLQFCREKGNKHSLF